MKTIVALLSSLVLIAPLAAQEKSAQELLRDGLFEEEANGDLVKAEAAYRKLVERYDEERRYAGTALFRLAELARKREEEEEAARLYRRVRTEFADHGELAKQADERLVELGVAPGTPLPGAAASTLAEQEELRRLQALAKSSPDLLNGLDENGRYPLHHAAANGWLRVADYLLERGAAIDARTSGINRMTPLHFAVIHGHLQMVERLAEAGADLGAAVSPVSGQHKIEDLEAFPVPAPPSLRGHASGAWSPLHLAVLYNRKAVARALLRHQARSDQEFVFVDSRQWYLHLSRTRQTPLILAVWLGNEEMTRILLKGGVEVNAVTGDGNSALFTAVLNARGLIPLLLEHGADPDAGSLEGWKAVHLAAASNDRKTLELLAGAGADLEARIQPREDRGRPEDGMNSLHLLVWRWRQRPWEGDELGTIEYLLAQGLEATTQALALAVRIDAVPLAERLIRGGAKVSEAVAGEGGNTPLHFARSGEMAKLLVAYGASVEARNAEGRTPLAELYAEAEEDTEKVRVAFDYLLAQGADGAELVLFPGRDRALRRHAIQRLVYPKEARGDAVVVAQPWFGEKSPAFRMERKRVEGTPAPTVPELAALFEVEAKVHSVSVFRPGEDGLERVAEVLPDQIREGVLPEVRWGDVVEFERGTSLRMPGREARAAVETGVLVRFLPALTVTIRTGPWEEVLQLERTGFTNLSATGLRLQDHFGDESQLLDLSQVRLKRGEAEPVVFNLGKGHEHPPIRLIDGDVVEVPLVPDVAHLNEADVGERNGVNPWNGVVTYFPDRPVAEKQELEYDLIYLLWIAEDLPGGRDLSRVLHYRSGKLAEGEERVRTIDLGALARKFPRSEWSREKVAELNVSFEGGSLLVVPPRAEASWQERIGHGEIVDEVLDEFIEFVKATHQKPLRLMRVAPRNSPAKQRTRNVPTPGTPNRSAPVRRVPTPPSR